MESTTATVTTNNISKYENKEIEKFIEGDYINIKQDESRTLEFIPDKAKLVDKLDFNGKPTQKVQFIVKDPQDSEQKEKKFEVSKKHVAKIYNELKKGKTLLEIYRSGTGKETNYIVKGIR